jgi:hypothetical protein
MLPRRNIPTVPSGEPLKSLSSDMGRATSIAGTGVAESRIGANEIDTRIDAPMNRTDVAASPNVNNPCAPMIPSVCAIM